MTDADAARAGLADDPEAFQEAYERLSPLVGSYLRRLVPRDEVEDVRQQVFLDVWRNRTRYDSGRKLEPWVLAIAKRRAIDHLRRRSRQPTDAVSALPPGRQEHTQNFVDTLAEVEELERALAELSDEQRTTLELAYYADLTQAEVAARLGVPIGTVKARTSRALRKLSELLVPPDRQVPGHPSRTRGGEERT